MTAFVISRSSLNISFVFIEEPYLDSLVHLQALLVSSFFSQSFVFLRWNQGHSEDWRSQPDGAVTWPGPPGRGPECRRAPQPLWASRALGTREWGLTVLPGGRRSQAQARLRGWGSAHLGWAGAGAGGLAWGGGSCLWRPRGAVNGLFVR